MQGGLREAAPRSQPINVTCRDWLIKRVADALEAGEVEVFPGELSRGAAKNFKDDPKALPAHLSSVLPVA